ncbi:MAG TPA: thiol reductant ABC exporter subunit CydC, partial [Spirochaetia bacterium]|nr:thiol reductant ABC exporter subunit CydC [Spirochaetia bacterium]
VGLLALSSWFIASTAIAGAAHLTMDFTLPSTGVRGLALGRTGGRYLERLVNHNTTFRILSRLRVWFFTRLEPLAPARLSRYRSGDLLSRIRADIDTLDDFYVRGFVPVLVAFLSVATIALFISGFSVKLMAVDLAALAAGGVLLPLLLMWLGTRPGRERVAAASNLRAAVVDGAQGSAELLAFGALETHMEKMIDLSAELTQSERRLNGLEGGADGGIILASGLAMWGGTLLLVPVVAGGVLPPADIAMLSVLMLASFESIMPLPGVFKRIGEMAAAARRLFEIIDAEPAVEEPTPSSVRLSGTHLEVEGLRFRYGEDQPWILDGLSFEVRRGERLAIVGPTGAGKSSLVNVLLRFWDYSGGRVRVDGVELRSRGSGEVRGLFSAAEQVPFLFHATLRENLLIGDPGADDAKLQGILEAVELGELLKTMEQGVDTVVGEGGLKLSVGQARRLSVARALLKEAPFLILDEPTEGLDDATADRLLDSIARSSVNRALIIISHRRRDLRIADRVIKIPVNW